MAQTLCSLTRRGGSAMAEVPRFLMVVGAATPPGRLAAAIAAAAEAVRSDADDINVDVMNLAEKPIDICDGRPLEGYGTETRQSVTRFAAAAAGPDNYSVYQHTLTAELDDAP